MTPTQEESKELISYLVDCLEEVQRVSDKLGVSNPFYNESYVEMLAADALGHTYNPATRGADAYDENDNPTEYKSINLSSKYKGSFQFHWLSATKLASYRETKDVFFIIRDRIAILEIWKLPMAIILPELIKKQQTAEYRRQVLNIAGANKAKNTDAHKSFSLKTVKHLGAELVYTKEQARCISSCV